MMLLSKNNERKIEREIGPGFNFIEKLKLSGIGSGKIVFLKGGELISHLNSSSQGITYISFELYKNGIIARLSKSNQHVGAIVKEAEVKNIWFEMRRILIITMGGMKSEYEALIEFELSDNVILSCYCPNRAFQSLLKFMKKGWLKQKTTFMCSTDKPHVDKSGLLVDYISKFI